MSDYTAKFQTNDELSLEAFAWTCARGCPAFISQKSEPLEAPPVMEGVVREELKSNYTEAQEAYRYWNSLSEEERLQYLIQKHAAYKVSRESELAENDRIREKCEAMIRRVTDWEVPEAYAELQEFMLYQLEAAMCSKVKKVKPVAPLDLSKEDTVTIYAKYETEYLHSRLITAKSQLEEEELRVQKCNEWKKGLAALLQSSR